MVYTTIYFGVIFLLACAVAGALFYWAKSVKLGILSFALISLVSWVVYFTFLDNYLARRWGGSMVVKLPENAQMIGMTWKDNSLWYQYYLPDTNVCVFREDAPVGIVEGEVRTPNCNPIGVQK